MRVERVDVLAVPGPASREVQRPGAVGVEVLGGKVRQRLVFEVGDDLLDDGVVAVLGLDDLRLVLIGVVDALPGAQELGAGHARPVYARD